MPLLSSFGNMRTASNVAVFTGGMAIVAMGVVFASAYVDPIVFGHHFNENISTGMRLFNGVCAVYATDSWILMKVVSYGTQHLFLN